MSATLAVMAPTSGKLCNQMDDLIKKYASLTNAAKAAFLAVAETAMETAEFTSTDMSWADASSAEIAEQMQTQIDKNGFDAIKQSDYSL